MGVTFVSRPASGINGFTSAASITPNNDFTGGLVIGRLYIAWCHVLGAGLTISVSGTGWTLGDSQGGTAHSSAWAWMIWNGTNSASPTFSWAGGFVVHAGNTSWNGALNSPIGNITKANGSSTSIAIGSVATTNNGSAFLSLNFAGASNAPPIPSGYADADHLSDAFASEQASWEAGFCTSATVTISSSGWAAHLIEILGNPTFPVTSPTKPLPPRLKRGHPLARGMITGFTFHEGGGGLITSDNGPNGPLTYSGLTGNSFRGGPAGASYYIPTTGTAPSIPGKRFEGLTKFSVVTRVWVNSVTGGAFWSKNDANGIIGFRFTDNITYFRIISNTNNVNTAANDVPIQTWAALAFVYDGTTMSILVNGFVKASGSFPSLTVPADGIAMTIGKTTAGVFQDAVFDYLYFYNRPLSQGEIGQINEDPFQMFRQTNIASYLRHTASTAVFRKTLSQVGGRIGSRQPEGWGM